MIIAKKLITDFTDSNGQVNYRYDSTGVGDVVFGATFHDENSSDIRFEEDSSFLIQTFAILDTKWYDNPTSQGVNKYTANTDVSISYDSTNEAYKIEHNSSNDYSSVTLNTYRFPNTVTLKADMMLIDSANNSQSAIGLLNNNTSISGKICFYSPDSYYIVSLIESTKTAYGSNEVISSNTHLNIQKNVWYTAIIEYNGNNQTFTLYQGDTVIGTVSATKSVLDSTSNELGIWSGFSDAKLLIKNIRVL